jgi:hypothetical protein
MHKCELDESNNVRSGGLGEMPAQARPATTHHDSQINHKRKTNMALQLSTSARNTFLDAVETAAGTAPKLRILTGAAPANCAAAQAGTLLVEMALPADWMAAAAAGSKALLGSWTAAAAAAGTAGHYRVVDTAGTTCHIQGSVTATGGGGDMTLDNVSIAAAQTVTVTAYNLSAGNA